MSDAPTNEGTPDRAEARTSRRVTYPTNHLLAVLDTPEQVASAVSALTSGGFLMSEVEVESGRAAADALGATTGRTGLRHLAVRIQEKIGYVNPEIEVRDAAEQALRDGRFVVLVASEGDERKEVATRILRDNGAHTMAYLGRLTVEMIVPPRAD